MPLRSDDENVITDILTFESKCLETSNTGIIKDAHQKLSAGLTLPSGVRELINLLGDYASPAAAKWRQSLLTLAGGLQDRKDAMALHTRAVTFQR
ncbi:MAG: hypothetical protein IPG74_13195 [Flavobacteriales bacterium]|nr:hypothetical protein [Flavobacteriales bacterium]